MQLQTAAANSSCLFREQSGRVAYRWVVHRNAASCVWFGLSVMMRSSHNMCEVTQTPCKCMLVANMHKL